MSSDPSRPADPVRTYSPEEMAALEEMYRGQEQQITEAELDRLARDRESDDPAMRKLVAVQHNFHD